ncbi:MAG: aminopeptidase [Steroidobacteraceae bacterium]
MAAAIRAAAAVAALAAASAGCYLLQSAQGQLALMSKREPIDAVIDKPTTSPALRAQLEAVASIREYASRDLGLPDNGSYKSYADVGRPYVVWNVVAAPEFSVDPKQWCYPFVGCVAYRGYFAEIKARKFAAGLGAEGLDVYVGGVAAYSTLGHFDDPILNTMVGWNDVELASIIFHELTHQMLYVPNDASFNEALATAVADEGVRRWLKQQGRDRDLEDYLIEEERYLEVIELFNATRVQLRAVYAEKLSPAAMREDKRAAFAAMRASYSVLKARWGGHAPFDAWFAADINNAHLASVATYYNCVPGFERELRAVDGDLPAFYRRVRKLANLPQKQRDMLVCGADFDPAAPATSPDN